LKNSPRTNIEFANEIDRASLASVTLEGFFHDFSRVDWRSIDRKSKAAELSKREVSRPNRQSEEKETGHLSSLLHQWFSPANLLKLLFTSGKPRYHRISTRTAASSKRFIRSCVPSEAVAFPEEYLQILVQRNFLLRRILM